MPTEEIGPCTVCKERPAAPGYVLCDRCLAELGGPAGPTEDNPDCCFLCEENPAEAFGPYTLEDRLCRKCVEAFQAGWDAEVKEKEKEKEVKP